MFSNIAMSVVNLRLKGGFGQCTGNVMKDPTICIRDKALYAYLCTYADGNTNQLNVSVFRMAAELNVSRQTILRSLKALELLNVIRRFNQGAGKTKITEILK